jgi:signal transduction histidine kinase
MTKPVQTIPQPLNSQTGRFASLRWRRCRPEIRYGAAVVAVALGSVVSVLLRDFFRGTPPALLFCAIIFSGWFGGFGPGLLASVLSITAIELFFQQPFPSHPPGPADIPRLTVFLIAGVFASLICERQRRDKAALTQAREELEEKVRARTAALTAANERLTIEVAERTRTETELQCLNRAWRVRNAVNHAVSRGTGEMDLLEQVCRAVVAEGGYRLAWVGYAEYDPGRNIRFVARAGEGQGYLDGLEATWGDGPRGIGPAGASIRTAQPVVVNDVSSDPRFAPWRARAEANGLKSSVALPLIIDAQAIGLLGVYSDEPAAFDQKETDLLLQAAADLSHGVALLRNRVARQWAEEALKESEAELSRVARVTAMGELTASIAHEVNQPLAAVVTYGNAGLRWLGADPPNLEEVREALGRIVRDGNRASDVIARIRAILKKSDAVARSLDVNEIIQGIVALTQGEAERRGAALKTELAAGLPSVMGDRVQLQQVLLNLVINALDAMNNVAGRPRVIRIRTSVPDARSILVAVEDSGAGLDPGQAGRLFEAFYTTKPEGLGMGLSISRSIVESHGGKLWATPNEGPGATFQFSLPIEEGARV